MSSGEFHAPVMGRVAMSLLLRLAWRNLLRHRRRNGLLLAAVMVGMAATVLSNALVRGYQFDLRDDAVDNLNGHLKVLPPGWLDDPRAGLQIEFATGYLNRPPVPLAIRWTARIRVPAVVLSERETRGVELVGIDPAAETGLSFAGDLKLAGDSLADASDGRLLLGRALADALRTDVGRRVVIVTQDAAGASLELGFRVVGVFDEPGRAREQAYAFTGRDRLARQLGMTGVSEVTVRLGDGGDDQLAGARAALAATLPAFDTRDWRSLDPLAAGMFEIIDAVLYVWLVIVLIALGFGLVNTLATAVIERTREFGLLRALGMRPRHVLAQVVMESVLVTLLGVVLGIAGGVALVALLHDGIDLTAWSSATALFGLGNVLVPRLLGADIVLVIVAALVFALVGSIYPAWRAVALAPLAALHGGRA